MEDKTPTLSLLLILILFVVSIFAGMQSYDYNIEMSLTEGMSPLWPMSRLPTK